MSEDPRRVLARWIAGHRQSGQALLVGINGAQGSGKSTLSQALAKELLNQHQLQTAILSLDDLYKTAAERRELAHKVHPLLQTRGVPGTHDIRLGWQLLERLRQLAPGESLAMPRFIKVADDRAPESDWRIVTGPVDVILFEGWCVGTPAQTEAELAQPVNGLEASEDPDGHWRRYVNSKLAHEYASLFDALDILVFLRIPDFESIHRWRSQQEVENARQAGTQQGVAMDADALHRFIQHYERLTRHALRVLPGRADAVLQLGPDHEILELALR